MSQILLDRNDMFYSQRNYLYIYIYIERERERERERIFILLFLSKRRAHFVVVNVILLYKCKNKKN